jgi:UDP-N-acetylglucosamine 4,6-dehydratase
MEAVKTNILGSSNVIDAALDANVKRVIAPAPIRRSIRSIFMVPQNWLPKKIFVQSNAYAGGRETRFACVPMECSRSRGSGTGIFYANAKTGKITITDERMTRFWISWSRECVL